MIHPNYAKLLVRGLIFALLWGGGVVQSDFTHIPQCYFTIALIISIGHKYCSIDLIDLLIYCVMKWWNKNYNSLVQDCSNSNALAMELLESCAEPSISVLKNCYILFGAWSHWCDYMKNFFIQYIALNQLLYTLFFNFIIIHFTLIWVSVVHCAHQQN